MCYFLCFSLYVCVAFFAARNRSIGGSHETHVVCWLANLTCTIEDNVPFGLRLVGVEVLLCLIKLNTLSSPALLCGITRINLEICDSNLYLSALSTFFICDMCRHTVSIR